MARQLAFPPVPFGGNIMTGWKKRKIADAQGAEMTSEDEEFNRLEMESKIRQEYVRQQLKKIPVVPTITEEEWEALNAQEE